MHSSESKFTGNSKHKNKQKKMRLEANNVLVESFLVLKG